MKLVQSAGGRDGEGEAELAPAESCALDDGEEEEIQFSQPLTAGILNRIKAMTGKVGKLQKSVNVNSFPYCAPCKVSKEFMETFFLIKFIVNRIFEEAGLYI